MNIQTLIPDIYKTISNKNGWFTDELASAFADDVSKRLQESLGAAKGPPRLRLSQMGPRCPCALWHSIHHPELAEPLPPTAEIKYAFGHIIEALAITLAKAAGHKVTGEQDVVHVDGVSGHRDCIIDGCIVDVKSANSFSFAKFKDGSIGQADTFGYLDQLDGYLVGSYEDDLVVNKTIAYLLAVDKTLGHMCLYEHRLDENRQKALLARVRYYRSIIRQDSPPPCECGTVPEGKSGNVKLDTRASYSDQKHSCFPGLRTFLYSSGPVYLTKVVRKPDVIEVDKHGKKVYN